MSFIFPSTLISVIRLHMKSACDLLCLYHIYKSFTVYLPEFFNKHPELIARYNRIYHCPFPVLICTDRINIRSPVSGDAVYALCYLPRLFCYYKHCIFLISFIQGIYHLCTCELKDDRIQRFVPAKEKSICRKHCSIEDQDIIPRIDPVLFRYTDSDKIRSAAGCPCFKAHYYRKAVYQTSEYT